MFRSFVISLLVTSVFSWNLKTSHTNVIMGMSEDVTLKCQGDIAIKDQTGPILEKITRIRILKQPQGKSWEPYADITLPNITEVKVHNQPRYSDLVTSGYLNISLKSFLSLTWTSASAGTIGRYKCEIDGFSSKNGASKTITSEDVNITNVPPSVDDLVQMIIHLRRRSQELSEGLKTCKDQGKKSKRDLKRVVENQRKLVFDQVNNLKEEFGKVVDNQTQLFSNQVNNMKQEFGKVVDNQTLVSDQVNNLKQEFGKVVDNKSHEILDQVESKLQENYIAENYWPVGDYSLLATADGCPNTAYSQMMDGYFNITYQTSLIQNHMVSYASHIKQPFYTHEKCCLKHVLSLYFCTRKKTNGFNLKLWPKGSYCIHTDSKHQCPPNFLRSHIAMYFASAVGYHANNYPYVHTSDVKNGRVELNYCCRHDRSPRIPIVLPTSGSYFLYRYKGQCQQVKNMEVTNEWMAIDTDDNKKDYYRNYKKHDAPDSTLNDVKIELCYYTKKHSKTNV